MAETLELSQLRGYRTGGTVHIVVNNQVGFTTSPESSRSSVYSTDVARVIQAPIFHVNGDDPEAVVRVGRLAFEYRQAFHKDVVIDMICYRRRGHNEADNPSFTQPLMYDLIDAKRSTRKLYTESLIGRGDITMEEAEQALRDYQQELERAFTETKDAISQAEPGALRGPRPRRRRRSTTRPCRPRSRPRRSSGSSTPRSRCPKGFTVHPRLLPQLQRRAAMVEQDEIDWATGELLAFGSVLIDGHSVRLIGQDPAGARSASGTPCWSTGILARSTPRCGRSTPQTARFHVVRLAAVGVRGGRLRVRLLGRAAGRAGLLGGAVRRLRQRRPDDRGRVHQLGRAEVGPAVRRRAAAAARLRGPGPGPLLGPGRAVPVAVRAGQHDGGDAEHTGLLFPSAALAGAVWPGQAADRVHAQVDAAAEGGRVGRGGFHHRLLPAGARPTTRRRRPGGGPPGAAVLRQGLLRPRRAAARGRAGPTSPSSGSSGCTRCPARRSPPSWPGTRPRPRSSGYRRSPPTWAAGRSWRCNLPEAVGRRSAWCPARRARRRPAARLRRTPPSRRRCSAAAVPERAETGVLHRPRASRNSPTGAARSRSRSPGSPSGCASSSMSTRRPKRRSTGWPAGWPGWTTTTATCSAGTPPWPAPRTPGGE